MYMLVSEPHGEEAQRAFAALDDTYGTDEFSKTEAMEVLTAHGFRSNMFEALVTAGSISEV